MSDIVISAIITVGGMVAVVILNEIAHICREERLRKHSFFKDLFPERLKAYQELLRAVAQSGVSRPLPFTGDVSKIEQTFDTAFHVLEDAAYSSVLLVDDDAVDLVFDMAELAATVVEAVKKEGYSKEVDRLLGVIQDRHDKLIELLREKSGIDIINEEFAETLNSPDNFLGKKKKAPHKDIGSQETRP